MRTRSLGNETVGVVTVGAIGLGTLGLTLPFRPARDRCVRTIHAAIDAGLTLLDTADSYCAGPSEFGYGERLVAAALAARPGSADAVLVATKGGYLRPTGDDWRVRGTPEYLRHACENSLRRLGVETIGLYQHHQVDPAVSYAESLGALRELWAEGKIRMVGICNVSIEQIEIARRVLGSALVSVQNRFAPNHRATEGDLTYCGTAGLAFLPWCPLGSIAEAGTLGARHPAFAAVAAERGVSPQQICLAWHLAKAPTVIPIPGASRPESVLASAAAAEIELTAGELARLDHPPE
ncbi:aldo/keto reductase [Nocardia sp. NPDC020380]|uniref:aldo/keto reductase n=1 Tax=Nocardia sp. NPDC020380 TaxID=3364309 RepID=UPI00378A88AF